MFKRISPRKISDEIIEQFKEMLRRGQLKPGDTLPSEREMAEMIGVSRPPLREALNALQTMGFVEIRPRSKIVVRSLAEKPLEDPLSRIISEDIDKLFELLEVRRAMESWLASKAAERAEPRDVDALEKILKRDQEDLRRKKDDAKTDADFHVAIALAAHNTLFSHLMASCYHLLWNTQKLAREKIFLKKGNREKIAGQHVRIFEAIRRKDPRSAAREAGNHIDFVERELRQIMAAQGETEAPSLG